MKKDGRVYAVLVGMTMIWGGSFVAIKQALAYLTPVQLVVMRFVPSAFTFAVLILLFERTAAREVLHAHWRELCLMGLLSVIIYHTALNTGEQLIPAGTASLAIALNPAFVFLLSALFLHEHMTWTQVLGLGVAFVGLFIIVRYGSGGKVDLRYLRGVLITVGAPLSWAAYTVLSRPLARRYSALALTGVANILGTLPMLLTVRADLFRRIAVMPFDGWFAIAYLSLACTVLAFTVWNAVLHRMEASRASGFIYLSPMWGVVFSVLVLGELLNGAMVAGAAVLIGGVALVNH